MPNEVQVAPVVALGQYKGLSVTRHIRPVQESIVQHEVVHQCRVHATYEPTAEPARRGDRAVLDFEGFLGGEAIPDSRMEAVEVQLGTGKLMPAAERAVYGHCAGETFSFDFTYPADFRVAELSGQTAQFTITLRSLERQQIPQADEAFAQSLGFASLDAMRSDIRAKKCAVHAEAADRKASAELLDAAGANLTVEFGETAAALEQSADREMAALRARLAKSGVTMEKYCAANKTTPEALRAQYRADAERRARNTLAVRAISEAEGIAVTNSEVEEEYHRLSRLHGTPEDEIRRVLAPGSIAAAVLTRKVQAFLLANANVTNVMDTCN
jgi:trigger factor